MIKWDDGAEMSRADALWIGHPEFSDAGMGVLCEEVLFFYTRVS